MYLIATCDSVRDSARDVVANGGIVVVVVVVVEVVVVVK